MSAVSELDGIQKAAILLITLGPEKAAGIFKHLKTRLNSLLWKSPIREVYLRQIKKRF